MADNAGPSSTGGSQDAEEISSSILSYLGKIRNTNKFTDRHEASYQLGLRQRENRGRSNSKQHQQQDATIAHHPSPPSHSPGHLAPSSFAAGSVMSEATAASKLRRNIQHYVQQRPPMPRVSSPPPPPSSLGTSEVSRLSQMTDGRRSFVEEAILRFAEIIVVPKCQNETESGQDVQVSPVSGLVPDAQNSLKKDTFNNDSYEQEVAEILEKQKQLLTEFVMLDLRMREIFWKSGVYKKFQKPAPKGDREDR